MAFRYDVPLRLAEAATLVEPPQAGVDRGVCRLLQGQVERRLDREALLVKLLRAVRALQIFAHLLDEIRRGRLGRCRLSLHDDRLLLGCVGVGLRDVTDISHPLQDVIAAAGRARQIHVGALAFRQLHDPRDEGCLFEREITRSLVEIHAGRRFDPVRPVSEVHVVAVEGEDLALGVPLLDLDREDRFLDLAFPRLVERQEQVPGELLGQGARTRALAVHDVACRRDDDARDAQAEMAVEPCIFRSHDRVPQRHRDVAVADDDPPLRGELPDDVAVERLEARDRARCVVVERRDLRQVVTVREQQARQRARYRREDEQRDDAGAAGKADD